MPGGKEPKEGSGNGRRFITEKIVKRPLSKGQLAKRGFLFLFLAALFGVIAAAAFAATAPMMSHYFNPDQEENATVSIPTDEAEDTSLPEGLDPTGKAAEESIERISQIPPEETAEALDGESVENGGKTGSIEGKNADRETRAAESQPIEQLVQDAVENYHYTIDDLDALFSSLQGRMKEADQSIVTVSSIRQQDVDWFDNPLETMGFYAGAIIAATETEFLIMVPLQAIAEADPVKLTFANGLEANGRLKQQDTVSGIAIVSVDKSQLDEAALEWIKPFVLGNSYLLKEGDILIAVGGPAGMVHSVGYGVISYIQTNTQMVDSTARVIYSDICADAARGTFFVNMAGELVGWAAEPEVVGADTGNSMACILGISDYKIILGNLSNGLGAPCLGIQGHVISAAMQEQGMPAGIYVFNAVADRPAYNAGIQNGDIITAVNGQETAEANEFQNIINSLSCGQMIHVTVKRNGLEDYAELEFQVTVGAR